MREVAWTPKNTCLIEVNAEEYNRLVALCYAANGQGYRYHAPRRGTMPEVNVSGILEVFYDAEYLSSCLSGAVRAIEYIQNRLAKKQEEEEAANEGVQNEQA